MASKFPACSSNIPEDNLSNTDYSQAIMQTLNKFRKEEIFCDVCLIVEDAQLMAHRIVLAASSPFFERLLRTGMKEKDQNKISLAGLKADVVKNVLDYIYVGDLSDLTMSFEKVRDLIVAADYLMLGRLKNLSVNHLLTENLNFDNCLSTWMFADRYQCSRLRDKARELVLVNFFDISRSDEFLDLEVSYLIELLACEGLAATNKEAFDSILAWINHDKNTRQIYFDQLIGNIDLLHIPRGYIDQVIATTQYAKESEFVKSIVGSTGECSCKSNEEIENSLVEGDSLTHCGNIALLLVGGAEFGKPGSVANVKCYLPSVSKWFPLQNMNIPRHCHRVAVHDGIVYALGGISVADDIECLDFKQPKLTWKRMLPMCSGHIEMAVTSLNGFLYVSGGACDFGTSNTVQRYNTLDNTWETVSPMMQAREGHCLIACSNYVYAIGGSCGICDPDNSKMLKAVECYDPQLDSWIPVSSMKTPRYLACGVELHNRIYVIGGQIEVYTDGPTMAQTNFRSSEVYCPRSDQWEMIAELLKIPRLLSCAAVMGHKIYVFGGYLDEEYLDTIECYDSHTGCWNNAGNLPEKLECSACCAVPLDGKTISLLLQSQSGKG